MLPSPDERSARPAAADRLAAVFAARASAYDAAGAFPDANIADLRAAGWPALVVPSDLGGAGAGLLDTVDIVERLARGDGSTALAFAMHLQTVGSAAASRSWAGDRFAHVCRAIVERGALVNACASEPELGSPSRGGLPRTVARRAGEGWRITGRKSFASLAPALDFFVVPAAIEGEVEIGGVVEIEGGADIDSRTVVGRREGVIGRGAVVDSRAAAGNTPGADPLAGAIGRFLVPREAGVTVVETWDGMGMRGTGSHDIVLDDVPVPAEHLLYRQSAAAPDPFQADANAWFTLLVSAVYLGVAAAAHAAALGYASTRVPTALGRPIASVEAIQRRAGAAELALLAARALLRRVAADWEHAPERRPDLGADIAGAKIFVTNAAIDVTDEAMRIAGGAAMRRDLPLERCYRDVRAGLYHPPSDDQGLALLGRLALRRFAGAPPSEPAAEPTSNAGAPAARDVRGRRLPGE